MKQLKYALSRVVLLQWLMVLIPWLLLQIAGVPLWNAYAGDSSELVYPALLLLGGLMLVLWGFYWIFLVRFINRLFMQEPECDFCGLFSCWRLWGMQSDAVSRYAPGYVSALYVGYALFPLAVLAGIFHYWGTMFVLLLLWCALEGLVRSALVAAVAEEENVLAREAKWIIWGVLLISVALWCVFTVRSIGVERRYRSEWAAVMANPVMQGKEFRVTIGGIPHSLPEFPFGKKSWRDWQGGVSAETLAAGEAYLFANGDMLREIRRIVAEKQPELWGDQHYQDVECLNMLVASSAGNFKSAHESWVALARHRRSLMRGGMPWCFEAEEARLRMLEALVGQFGAGSVRDMRVYLAELAAAEEEMRSDIVDYLTWSLERGHEFRECRRPPAGWGNLLPEMRLFRCRNGLARIQILQQQIRAAADYAAMKEISDLSGMPGPLRNELRSNSALLTAYWEALSLSRAAQTALMVEQLLRTRGGLPENLAEYPRDPKTGLAFVAEVREGSPRAVEIGGFRLRIQ